ncbi:coagulation factor XIII B chain-like isoform X2 [Hyperolius riggenbachi]|uniref:coagulation factor XIII B chain-like isoform X2 n=1 Tax=Hyperolius riggenbachi TaxID=752182 RepID=UPI0035A31D45
MTLLEYLLLLSAVVCCNGEPASDSLHPAGGQDCGAPPTVPNGDITGMKKLSYISGSSVQYQCPYYYKLEGKANISCQDGEWEKEPICRVPCTVTDAAMIQNNIRLKYKDDRKLYSEHLDIISFDCIQDYEISDTSLLRTQCSDGKLNYPKCTKKVICTVADSAMNKNNIRLRYKPADRQLYAEHLDSIQFDCIEDYEISDTDLLRIQCLHGELNYPKCFKKGFCVLQQAEMSLHNISYNKSREIENKQTIRFQCTKGTVTEESLEATCINKQILYPKCVSPDSSCGSPPEIENGKIREQNKTTYLTGTRVFYDCDPSFSMGQKSTGYITCENKLWTHPPVCRRTGQSCNAPPAVQNGDIIGTKKISYESGSSVYYKCAHFFKLEGNGKITCQHGEWETEPICRAPCTVTDAAMKQSNINLRYMPNDRKLYVEHLDSISFNCIKDYEISDASLLRIQCLDGVINYPKCYKEGNCIPPKIANGKVHPVQEYYDFGSSVAIECEEPYVLDGHSNVFCNRGQWSDLPQCAKPCTISATSLEDNHIELVSPEDQFQIHKHLTEMNLKCKRNFRRPGIFVALCFNGIVKYPRCFASRSFCRIDQQQLDDNFLELHENYDHEIYYEEGDIVHFKCKTGYKDENGLTGRCLKPPKPVYAQPKLNYPTCMSIAA